MSLDANKFVKALQRLQGNWTHLVTLDAAYAVCIITTIQLATKHPQAKHNDALRRAVSFAHQLHRILVSKEPDLAPFLDHGWAEPYLLPQPEQPATEQGDAGTNPTEVNNDGTQESKPEAGEAPRA